MKMNSLPSPRLPFPEGLRIVALDTCVLRALCYDKPTWLEDFSAMSVDGIAFCLSDLAFLELYCQIQGGTICPEQLELMVKRAESFLYLEYPVLPGGHDLQRLVCAHDKESRNGVPNAERSRSLWTAIGELGPADEDSAGVEDQGKTGAYASDVITEERQKWLKLFQCAKASFSDDTNATTESLLAAVRSFVDSGSNCSPALSVRVDLAIRFLASKIISSNAENGAYKASSPKRSNDGLDYDLYFSLMIPALLVSKDRGVVNAGLLKESYQASWVSSPEGLAEVWENGEMIQPTWPSES